MPSLNAPVVEMEPLLVRILLFPIPTMAAPRLPPVPPPPVRLIEPSLVTWLLVSTLTAVVVTTRWTVTLAPAPILTATPVLPGAACTPAASGFGGEVSQTAVCPVVGAGLLQAADAGLIPGADKKSGTRSFLM